MIERDKLAMAVSRQCLVGTKHHKERSISHNYEEAE